jgi:hypothetical protein
MVVLITPHSVAQPWVLLEVGGAFVYRKGYRIVAVLCHVEVDSIPSMLKSKRAIDLNELDLYVAEVSERVKDWKK